MARRPWFEPGPVHVGFVADKVSLGRTFRCEKRVSASQRPSVCPQLAVSHCYRRHKLAPRALVCNTQYIYTADVDM